MGFKINDTLEDIKDLSDHKALIFGGTGGLGRAIANLLASLGSKVTVVGQTFRDSSVENISFIKADLSSIEESIRTAKSIDVSNTDLLLFTTGIFASRQKEISKEGLEKDMAVSYLNRLAIIDALASDLPTKSGSKARVFIMGFPGNGALGAIEDLNQDKSYNFYTTHMSTVAGNEALVTYGKKNYPNANFYGLNPGLVKTNIRNNLFGEGYFASSLESVLSWFNPTAEEYAKTITPALVSLTLDNYNGALIDKNKKELAPSKGLTESYALEYITKSKELLKSKGF